MTKEPCLQTSYAENILELNNTDVDPSGFGERQWLFQTCSEFGFCEWSS